MKSKQSRRIKTSIILNGSVIFIAAAILLFVLTRFGIGFYHSLVITGIVVLLLSFTIRYVKLGQRKITPLPHVQRRNQLWHQVRAIAAISRSIREPKIALCARDIAKSAASVLRKADKHPERYRLLHRYFDYYLQAALSILDRCESLTQSPVFDREMDRQIQEAERALRRLVKRLDQQMLGLMESEVWELEIERKTLEKLMAESSDEHPPSKGGERQ